MISNIPHILKQSFLELSNSANSNNNNNNNRNAQVWYLRMSQVDFEETNEKICSYRITNKYKQIKCLILYGHPPQHLITDSSAT